MVLLGLLYTAELQEVLTTNHNLLQQVIHIVYTATTNTLVFIVIMFLGMAMLKLAVVEDQSKEPEDSDSDNDGYDDLYEIINGYDPNDPNSKPSGSGGGFGW